ncbi:hypothetical protein GM160_06050 [Guyparkeria halophila]|uniref:Uncharacterized protein n=1 Tax=Guyparkeria halophila TaxID=47960 RepID=A0A6I6D2S6_9GAMM|nr:hypothetical protein [Guyparkeria halophila]QGT78495.1 hypothetical protein GM160_06050 [Guyparkeria halophila]
MTARAYYLTTRRALPGVFPPVLIRHLVAGPFASRAEAEAYRRRHELNAAEVRSRTALAAEIKANEREAVA